VASAHLKSVSYIHREERKGKQRERKKERNEFARHQLFSRLLHICIGLFVRSLSTCAPPSSSHTASCLFCRSFSICIWGCIYYVWFFCMSLSTYAPLSSLRAAMCVCVCARVCVYVYVCVCERERETERECVCVPSSNSRIASVAGSIYTWLSLHI